MYLLFTTLSLYLNFIFLFVERKGWDWFCVTDIRSTVHCHAISYAISYSGYHAISYPAYHAISYSWYHTN
jgi:hypothetical protein